MKKTEDYGNFYKFIKKAKEHSDKIIVLPEGEEDRIISAANLVAENGVCQISMLGDKSKILPKLTKKAASCIEIINPKNDSEVKEYYANKLYELRKDKGLSLDDARKLLSNNIYFGTMMVKNGDADGLVAGAVTHTADILKPAFQIIKTKPGIEKASSSFIMEVPNKYSKSGFMVFADCAVNVNPTSKELASIAISSADTAKKLCDMKPVVALLSYSTNANEDDPKLTEEIAKVKDAYKEVRRMNSSLDVVGEIQADAAIDEVVAKLKYKGNKIAGNANVLVFPDLNSGNIAYKLVSKLGGLNAVGPLIQGLNSPVNDLSRSASVKEIFLTIALTVIQTI